MKLMLTLIAVVILNGCASQPQQAASHVLPKSKTIVMPGCLPIGKELHCQWIDPPQVEEPARVHGIAL